MAGVGDRPARPRRRSPDVAGCAGCPGPAWDNPGHGQRGSARERARRDGRRERPRPHALEPPRRDPQGERARPLPADLDRAVGGERDRDEAPGPDARAAADPRPVRGGARGPRRPRRPGRSSRRSPRRRSTPGSCSSSTAGSSRSTRGRPTRSRWRSGPAAASSPPRRSSTRRRSARTARRGRRGGRRAGSRSRRPASTSSIRGWTCSATSSTRSTSIPGPARSGGGARPSPRRRPGFRGGAPAHGSTRSAAGATRSRARRGRSRCGFAPVGEPAVRGWCGHADLDDRPAGGVQLDQQLGREERAARLDRDPRQRLAPEQLAGAVDVADLEAEPDPDREPVQPGVDRPDERVRPLDPVADDGVGLVGLAEAGGEPAEVRDPELAVAVGERDELVARRPGSRTAAPRRSRGSSGGGRPGRRRGSPRPARRRSRRSRRATPSLTTMISNVSASVGSVSSASATSSRTLASSLWAGKK